MAGIFSFIGFLGVLVGGAAAAAGLYQTFGDTQAAVDAWVSGAQVFFLGAMLMALGSVAARVRGTTRAVDELAKSMRGLRNELATLSEAANHRAERRVEEMETPILGTAGARRSAASRPIEADLEPGLDGPSLRSRGEEREPRAPVLDRRPVRERDPAGPRAGRLGPALGEEDDRLSGPVRRATRGRRPFDED